MPQIKAIVALVIWLLQAASGFLPCRPLRNTLAVGRRCHASTSTREGLITVKLSQSSTSDAFDGIVDTKDAQNAKRIVLIRHGCTYMNEYLSEKGTRWGDPHFTDIFDDESLYRDSPLSPRGIRQAKDLSSRLLRLVEDAANGDRDDYRINDPSSNIIEDIELIACSPLTRALQTMDIALSSHIWPGKIPIIALPQASERVYLISDLGTATSELKMQYPVVDFDSEIANEKSDEWWYSPSNDLSGVNHEEWRPNDEGQKYACPGEPEAIFNERMALLYDWLEAREETCIALICHWGVIDWLTGDDFNNCEMRVIEFASMNREGFMLSDEEADELFKQGERCVVRDQ